MTKEQWIKQFIQLSKFLKENKRYPQIDAKNPQEKNLAVFIRQQRAEYKSNILAKYKENLLNDIHFCWTYDKVKNDDSIQTWQKFEDSYIQQLINQNGARLKKNGRYKNSKLSQWENKQRKEERRGGLEDDREYELKKVGFYFNDSKLPKNQQRSIWFKNYNKLIELLKIVNGDYKALQTLEEFKSISNWFNNQIDEEIKGGLEDDRKYLLDNISFPFEQKYKKNRLD